MHVKGLIVVSIQVINTVLSYISVWLTTYEKHHTRSSEARSLTHKLFLSQVGSWKSYHMRAFATMVARGIWRNHVLHAPITTARHKTTPLQVQFLNSALSTIVASAYLPWLRPISDKLGGFFFKV